MKTIKKFWGNTLCRGIMLLLFVLMNVQVFAYDFKSDGIYYKKTSSNTVEVTYRGGTYDPGYSGSVTIPDSVTYGKITYYVTTIGDKAFNYSSRLTSINIPDGVTSIGTYAFYECTSLTTINIPGGVTSISKSTFESCTSLTEITIPDGVTSIGNYAFSGCTSLTSITIPDGVTTIGAEAFRGCSSLTSITIPASVTTIEGSTFCGCTSLTSIVIPDGVTSIDNYAFQDCTSLTEIIIPNGVTSIGNYAFEDCTSLTSATIIGSGATSIERYAFSGCRSLTEINIQGGVTSIGNYAFSYCKSLPSINIPDCVTSIGERAFESCSSMTSATIGSSVTKIGDYAFHGCYELTEFNSKNPTPPSMYSNTFENRIRKQCVLNVPVGSKDLYAKANYWKLFGTSNIKEVDFTADADAVRWEYDGMYYVETSDNTVAVTYLDLEGTASYTGEITIPDSVVHDGKTYYVTSIGNYAFCNCLGLTGITIPDSVKTIGEYAFYDCFNLDEINSKNPTPPSVYSNTFESSVVKTCVLNVPIGSKTIYRSNSVWVKFYNINEVDFSSGIENVNVDGNGVLEVGRYTLDGKNIQTPQSGINIIKYSDGTTKKVLVK